jgi:hypothetical protein
MASSGAGSFLQRLPHDFAWDERFLERRLLSYDAEDTRVLRAPNEDVVIAFLNFRASHLNPPCFNFEALARFLRLANSADLTSAQNHTQFVRLALIADRRDFAGIEDADKDLRGWTAADLAQEGMVQIGPDRIRRFNGQKRDWASFKYSRDPPKGDHISRELLDEQALYERLQSKVVPTQRSPTSLLTRCSGN